MKYIVLPHGILTVVDDKMYDFLNQWKWHIQNGYVCRTLEDGTTLKMHNVVLPPPTGMITDHKNSVTLDNCLENLRHATKDQNRYNRKISSNNTTGYKGVNKSHRQKLKPYLARISFQNKRICLGYHVTPEQAALAYNKAAIELYGEFAKLNVIERS